MSQRKYFVNHDKRKARAYRHVPGLISSGWYEVTFEVYSEYVKLKGYQESVYG